MFERLGNRFAGTILFFDVTITLLCLHISSKIRIGLEYGKNIGWERVQLPWQLYTAVAIIWVVVFILLSPHRAIFRHPLVEAIGRLLGAVGLATLSFAGLLYLTLRDVSRLQFSYFVLLTTIALLALHITMRVSILLRQSHYTNRTMLVVGGGESSDLLAQELARHPWSGIRLVGYTNDKRLEQSLLPYLGTIDETVVLIQSQHIDEVVFTLPPHEHNRMAQMLLQLQQYPVMVHMIPSIVDLAFARTPAHSYGDIPLISFRESALSDTQRLIKRLFDIAASMLLIVFLLPLMLIIALLIFITSPGGVFFLQERIGEHGRRFKMIKFRTMYRDAEQRWHEVMQRDEQGNILHKQRNDPRVTSVGRVLRHTSMDELPQLFNVLIGQMSLVGPRPEMPYIAQEYEPWQWQRFRVPPGITGWWQVNGRSDKLMHLHTEEDLYYIQNYSFWLDVRILLKTVFVVVRGQGAY